MTLEEVQSECGRCMVEITELFKPGVKITVLVRTPSQPDLDFMMTDDVIPELRAMLDRREAGGSADAGGEL